MVDAQEHGNVRQLCSERGSLVTQRAAIACLVRPEYCREHGDLLGADEPKTVLCLNEATPTQKMALVWNH